MKEKKPWYARCADFILRAVTNKKVIIIFLCVTIIWLIASISMFNFLKNEYFLPYEEKTNFQFYVYADFILEDISIMVIEEGVELRLEHIPYTVSEYNVNYTKNGIEFWYCLDKEEIISQYKMITGKELNEIPEDERLEKTIWMADEFYINYETSLFDNIPSREEYHYKQIQAIKVISVFVAVYLILSLGFILLLVINFTVIAKKKWQEKQNQKENFHNNST